MRQSTHKLIAILFLVPILFSLFGMENRVFAQTPPPQVFASPVTMQAYPALEGYYKYGEWLPIWIEVENNGPDTRAEIRVPISGSGGVMIFTTPLELPAGARKRTTVYVLPNNYSRQLQVDLLAGTETLATQKITVHPQANIAFLTGIIAPERGALALLQTIDIPGAKRPQEVIDLKLADLPEKYEGLRSLDLLVLNNTDTSSLTPEQAAALETWVRQGGRLVVGGGANAQSAQAGLPATLLPLTIQEIGEMQELPGLEKWIDANKPVRVSGPFVAASGSSEAGTKLASQDDLVLVWEWARDRGLVNFVALDLSGSPFDAWSGTKDFWEKLVSQTAVYPVSAPADVSARQQFASSMTYPLSNLPMLDLPSARGLALLLGVYILLVGPANYFVLRKQKKLHLAWVTIPAITLVFSAASFGIGYALHGSDVFVNKIAIIQVEPSGKSHVDSFIGLFSPAQSAYEIQIEDGGLVSPLSPYYDPWSASAAPGGLSSGRSVTLQQGSPAYIRGLNVEQWSMQSFMSEGIPQDFGAIAADLRLEENRLVGEIHNRSSYELQDAAVIMGNNFVRLDHIAAGQTIPVELKIETQSGPNFGASLSYNLFQDQMNSAGPGPQSRQAEVKRAIVESLFERTQPFISAKRFSSTTALFGPSLAPVLIGWLDEAPPRVRVSNTEPAQQTTAIVVVPLSYAFPESGIISLPAGLIPGELVENPLEGGSCGPTGVTAVYIGRGEAVFEFTLPLEAQNLQLDHLKLAINNDSGMFTEPTIELYQWQTETWIPLVGVSQGVNMVPGADQLVSPGGKVKVRLSAQSSQGCYYVYLGLEGRQP